ncbi:hypothetical protein CASFOL_034222 [Castilleja foliolosa]|uniref:Dirigent protein n=1 Tax=Castilleja foliolosa TaxID=1961234 RepID=A0ABD3BWZ1_9LAMI
MRPTMTNPSAIFIFFSILLALVGPDPSGASTLSSISTRSLDKYFKNLNPKKTTLTKLQIYIHANFAISENQTVFQVASSKITRQSPTTFGRILIIDNPLTVTSDSGSGHLGQYQGMNAYSDFQESSANMNMNMFFSGGEYEGSSMSILGRQPVNEEVRVLSVIGGTGFFRLAKGVVQARTLSLDLVTKIGHYVYDMYVVTPRSAAGWAHAA